jgi:hypothetical protein
MGERLREKELGGTPGIEVKKFEHRPRKIIQNCLNMQAKCRRPSWEAQSRENPVYF